MILVRRFRLKDRHASELARHARAVNIVWNYCNETQRKAAQHGRPWLSSHDLERLTAGSYEELAIPAQTICKVCQQYDRSRRQRRKPWLRFRGRKSLGWVPFHGRSVGVLRGRQQFRFGKLILTPMHWRDIPDGRVCDSSISQDARGRWYLNLSMEVCATPPVNNPSSVGVDLGLKHLAVLSNGATIEAPQCYRRLERDLGRAQRASKTKQARGISARIANTRRDFLHKASNSLAAAHGLIVVGNVSGSRLAQTRMAKSALDAGWSTLRHMLSYKAVRHGGRYIEVDERYTTQTCSCCGSLPSGRPRGIAGLGIREWVCDDCGAVHDRDVNAARNILRIGLDTLAEGAAPMRSSQPLQRLA